MSEMNVPPGAGGSPMGPLGSFEPTVKELKAKGKELVSGLKADLKAAVQDLQKGIQETASKAEKWQAECHTALPAKAMGGLVNSAAFKAIFGTEKPVVRGASREVHTEQKWVSARKGTVAGAKIDTAMLDAAKAQDHRSLELKTELAQIKKVLSECADGTRSPTLTSKGELKATNRLSDAGGERALNYMIRTMHEAGVLEAGTKAQLGDLEKELESLPATAALAEKDTSFKARLEDTKKSIEAMGKGEEKMAPISKEMLLGKVMSGDVQASLLLITTHRDNSETRNLFKDLNKDLEGALAKMDKGIAAEENPFKRQVLVEQRDKVLTHLASFSAKYLREGDSIPLGGAARNELRTEILKLAETLKTAGKEVLGTELENLARAALKPSLPPLILDPRYQDLLNAPGQLSEGQIREAHALLRDAETKALGPILICQEDKDRSKEDLEKVKSEVAQRFPGVQEAYSALRKKLEVQANGLEQMPFDLSAVSAKELSKTVCQATAASFAAIDSSELAGLAWSKEEKYSLAPHVLNHTQLFNKISMTLQHQILNSANPDQEAAKVIEAAKMAFANHNYEAGMAMVAALEASPVHRMKEKIWSKLDAQDIETFESFKSYTQQNYKELRATIEKDLAEGHAVVPYIGMYLTDLTFTAEGNPATVEGNINLGRNKAMNGIKEQIKLCKKSVIQSGVPRPAPLKFAATMALISARRDTSDDALYALSLKREPRRKT